MLRKIVEIFSPPLTFSKLLLLQNFLIGTNCYHIYSDVNFYFLVPDFKYILSTTHDKCKRYNSLLDIFKYICSSEVEWFIYLIYIFQTIETWNDLYSDAFDHLKLNDLKKIIYWFLTHLFIMWSWIIYLFYYWNNWKELCERIDEFNHHVTLNDSRSNFSSAGWSSRKKQFCCPDWKLCKESSILSRIKR